MERRSLFYLSKVFIESLKKGEDYSKLKRTITINILDFILFDNNEPFHTTFHLYEDQNKNLLLTDAFEVHFIELPKFERVVKELDHPLHRYLMFLSEHLTDEQR
jgi:predicted transposase/invertase (TIGR01784 family)